MKTLGSLLVLVALSACTDAMNDTPPKSHAESTPQVTALLGSYWKLTELSSVDALKPGPRGDAHVILSEGDLKGSSGCNRLFGKAEIGDSRIRLGPIGSTKMACPDYAEQERGLLQALESADRYALASDQLTLFKGDKTVARFQAAKSP